MTETNNNTNNILKEAEELRKNKDEIIDVEEEQIKLVIFTISDVSYAFYGKHVKEIIPYEEITYVPGTPDFIMGLINLRGNFESVINICKILQINEATDVANSFILIAKTNTINSGILVDFVEDVEAFPKSTIKKAPSVLSNSLKDFVDGELEYNDKNITILNLEKIFHKLIEK